MVAHADDPPKLISYPPQKIMGFRGLDTKSNAPLIEDGRASDLQNIKLSSSYDLKKRDGYDMINDVSLDDNDILTPVAINGMFDASFSNGTSFLIAFLDNKIKYNNSGIWTDIGNWWEAPTVTAGDNNTFVCTMALDTPICTNDVDVPIEINSTPTKSALDVSDLTDTLTKAKTVTWFRNYLIFANTYEASTERPTRFRWSNVGTTETWTDDDFNDIAELGGDEIIGMKELYGNLYIFLKNSIYKVTLVGGDDVFSFDKVLDGLGAVAKNSIQVVRVSSNQSAIIFFDEHKKVYLFTGLVAINIGELIQPTLDSLNATRLEYAVSAYDTESYYLSVSNGSNTTNNLLLEYQVEIGEWTKHTDINANAMARVDLDNLIKTYFGNYDSVIYWLADPDKKSDIDGATGVIDSVGTTSITSFITGGQVLVDLGLSSGSYSGATIKITSGTAAGEERVILFDTDTMLIVTTAFSTKPDSTSNYSIGAIDANYTTKWYDLGDSPRKKLFRELYFWASEASDNQVTVSYSKDFGTTVGSKEQSLAPSADSLWDTALWDQGIWGTTGDKFYKIPMGGRGRFVNLKFEEDTIDKSFKIYGYNIIADALDIR